MTRQNDPPSLDTPPGGRAPDVGGPLVSASITSLLALVREQLGLDVIFVSEFFGGRRVFRQIASAPGLHVIEPGDSHAIEDSICQRVLDGRVPNLVADLRVLRTQQVLPDYTAPLGTHISVPVTMSDGSVYGMLCGFTIERCAGLRERDVRRLELAAQATARLLAHAAGHGDAHVPVDAG